MAKDEDSKKDERKESNEEFMQKIIELAKGK